MSLINHNDLSGAQENRLPLNSVLDRQVFIDSLSRMGYLSQKFGNMTDREITNFINSRMPDRFVESDPPGLLREIDLPTIRSLQHEGLHKLWERAFMVERTVEAKEMFFEAFSNYSMNCRLKP